VREIGDRQLLAMQLAMEDFKGAVLERLLDSEGAKAEALRHAREAEEAKKAVLEAEQKLLTKLTKEQKDVIDAAKKAEEERETRMNALEISLRDAASKLRDTTKAASELLGNPRQPCQLTWYTGTENMRDELLKRNEEAATLKNKIAHLEREARNEAERQERERREAQRQLDHIRNQAEAAVNRAHMEGFSAAQESLARQNHTLLEDSTKIIQDATAKTSSAISAVQGRLKTITDEARAFQASVTDLLEKSTTVTEDAKKAILRELQEQQEAADAEREHDLDELAKKEKKRKEEDEKKAREQETKRAADLRTLQDALTEMAKREEAEEAKVRERDARLETALAEMNRKVEALRQAPPDPTAAVEEVKTAVMELGRTVTNSRVAVDEGLAHLLTTVVREADLARSREAGRERKQDLAMDSLSSKVAKAKGAAEAVRDAYGDIRPAIQRAASDTQDELKRLARGMGDADEQTQKRLVRIARDVGDAKDAVRDAAAGSEAAAESVQRRLDGLEKSLKQQFDEVGEQIGDARTEIGETVVRTASDVLKTTNRVGAAVNAVYSDAQAGRTVLETALNDLRESSQQSSSTSSEPDKETRARLARLQRSVDGLKAASTGSRRREASELKGIRNAVNAQQAALEQRIKDLGNGVLTEVTRVAKQFEEADRLGPIRDAVHDVLDGPLDDLQTRIASLNQDRPEEKQVQQTQAALDALREALDAVIQSKREASERDRERWSTLATSALVTVEQHMDDVVDQIRRLAATEHLDGAGEAASDMTMFLKSPEYAADRDHALMTAKILALRAKAEAGLDSGQRTRRDVLLNLIEVLIDYGALYSDLRTSILDGLPAGYLFQRLLQFSRRIAPTQGLRDQSVPPDLADLAGRILGFFESQRDHAAQIVREHVGQRVPGPPEVSPPAAPPVTVPQPEAPQPEAPQPEAPQPEAPQPEAPQPEAPQPEAPPPAVPRSAGPAPAPPPTIEEPSTPREESVASDAISDATTVVQEPPVAEAKQTAAGAPPRPPRPSHTMTATNPRGKPPPPPPTGPPPGPGRYTPPDSPQPSDGGDGGPPSPPPAGGGRVPIQEPYRPRLVDWDEMRAALPVVRMEPNRVSLHALFEKERALLIKARE
jgi:hypothetical protein